MACVVTDGTSNRQDDGHLVPGLQSHGHDDGGAVLVVLLTLLQERSPHLIIHLQLGADPGVVPRIGTGGVDGHGETVDTGEGGGEDSRPQVVVAPQVDEDFFVEYR